MHHAACRRYPKGNYPLGCEFFRGFFECLLGVFTLRPVQFDISSFFLFTQRI